MARPDIVVGIDFGMTSTGVAYSSGPDWPRPETIQNWPGNTRGSIADKIDTKIAYNAAGNVVGWGFAIDEADVTNVTQEYFKLCLDPDYIDNLDDAPSLQEARAWFVDYLTCLFKTVNRYLNDVIPKYHSKKVEFKFSVPTTWKNPAMIAETEHLIRNAGFGNSPLHTSEITLTEAEAAAVYAAQQSYETGQAILVCDAGGGTSDVNILKVMSSGVGLTELTPLQHVEGRAIGSTLIDFRVEKLIVERLRAIEDTLTEPVLIVANRMIKEKSRFESFKCNLGDGVMHMPILRLSIPGIAAGVTVKPHIENSHVILSKIEIEQIFDRQVERLYELIDSQLRQLEKSHPGELITYLILSGGLGSSPYLQRKLQYRYLLGKSGHDSMRDVQILRVPKPQLAVCHGLVLDRIQQLKENRMVYKERLCRNSYGVIYRVEYNPLKHVGEPVTYDGRDGKTYVLNQIDWFIIQGQKVSVNEGVKRHYSLKVPIGGETQPWVTQIVMSALPADRLPTSLNQPGARRLCQVRSRLPIDMKVKNSKWYQRSDPYFKAEFDVQVLVGAADLRFQTLDQRGLLSQDHTAIDIDWYSSSAVPSAPGNGFNESSNVSSNLETRTATENAVNRSLRATKTFSGHFARRQGRGGADRRELP